MHQKLDQGELLDDNEYQEVGVSELLDDDVNKKMSRCIRSYSK